MTALETSTLLETIPTLVPGYYHLGFHILASLLTFGLHTNPLDVIQILGQITLAAIPIPIFFLVRDKTQSDAAAFFGMLLAGFGWYMPGFAVNWGKYPALIGLLALEIVLSTAISFPGQGRRKRFFWDFSLLVGITVSTLFHTRTLVVIAIPLQAGLQRSRCSSHKTYQYISLRYLLAGILVSGALVQADPY